MQLHCRVAATNSIQKNKIKGTYKLMPELNDNYALTGLYMWFVEKCSRALEDR